MTLVKICGVTNTEDALAAVEAGADFLGLNFYPKSPRHISTREARKIVEGLPGGVLAVAVLVNESAEEVLRAAAETGVSVVQLHGDESPEFCAGLRGLSVIKALRVGADFEPEEAGRFKTEAVLLDAYAEDERGGTGRTFDWSVAARTREVVGRLVLAGGLTPANVASGVRAVRPYAVDVCSGVEISPGRKSFELMRRFVAEVRAASDEAGAPRDA